MRGSSVIVNTKKQDYILDYINGLDEDTKYKLFKVINKGEERTFCPYFMIKRFREDFNCDEYSIIRRDDDIDGQLQLVQTFSKDNLLCTVNDLYKHNMSKFDILKTIEDKL